MFEHGARERLRALDVREVGRALEDVKPRAGTRDAMSSACSTGVAGSSAPATTSTGAAIAEIRSRASQAPTASQHRA